MTPTHGPITSAARCAFTFIEMMMVVAVIGIIAFTVIPAMAPEEGVKLVSASHMVAADLEYAQSASLASPADPIVVMFQDKAPTYWLAHASDPDTPIERPGSGSPYVVEMGVELAQALGGVAVEVQNTDDGRILYDSFGRLAQLDDAYVKVTNLAGDIFVRVSATTGSVEVTKSPPPPPPAEEPPAEALGGGAKIVR